MGNPIQLQTLLNFQEMQHSVKKLSVSIAKNGKEGFLSLSTQSLSRALIRGKVTLYLDDAITIACVGRGIYDYVNDTATSIYYLTEKEIEKLMSTNITTIRYSLRSEWDKGNYAASNVVLKSKIKYRHICLYVNYSIPRLLNRG